MSRIVHAATLVTIANAMGHGCDEVAKTDFKFAVSTEHVAACEKEPQGCVVELFEAGAKANCKINTCQATERKHKSAVSAEHVTECEADALGCYVQVVDAHRRLGGHEVAGGDKKDDHAHGDHAHGAAATKDAAKDAHSGGQHAHCLVDKCAATSRNHNNAVTDAHVKECESHLHKGDHGRRLGGHEKKMCMVDTTTEPGKAHCKMVAAIKAELKAGPAKKADAKKDDHKHDDHDHDKVAKDAAPTAKKVEDAKQLVTENTSSDSNTLFATAALIAAGAALV